MTGLVILAAGASTRLGRPKQLLENNGKLLLQHVIDLAEKTGCHPMALVLGANASSIRRKVNSHSLDVIVNDKWEDGISSSIRFGLAHLGNKERDLQNVLILLSDQPFLSDQVLKNLLSTEKNLKSITACEYGGQIGVPALFSHHFFDELMKLEGDEGAKKIIMKNREYVSSVPFERGEVDVDTEEDYKRLIN